MSTKKKPESTPKPQEALTRPRSPAQTLQALTMQHESTEQHYAVTLRDEHTFEYHVELPRAAVEALLDPDVPDTFIEVPCRVAGTRRFVHTAFIKEIDVRGYE